MSLHTFSNVVSQNSLIAVHKVMVVMMVVLVVMVDG